MLAAASCCRRCRILRTILGGNGGVDGRVSKYVHGVVTHAIRSFGDSCSNQLTAFCPILGKPCSEVVRRVPAARDGAQRDPAVSK